MAWNENVGALYSVQIRFDVCTILHSQHEEQNDAKRAIEDGMITTTGKTVLQYCAIEE